jgi:GT2 family glycosyltransferase
MSRLIFSVLSFERPELLQACVARLIADATRMRRAGDEVEIRVREHSRALDLDAELKQLAAAGGCRLHYRIDRSNPGFGAGHNCNLIEAAAHDDDVFIVLNDDFHLDFAAFCALAAGHWQRGEMVGCLIRTADGAPWFSGGSVCRWTGDLRPRHHPPAARTPDADSRIGCLTDYLTGCLLSCRAGVFRRLGGFAEDYFMYSEDTALCRRARRLGVAMRVLPIVGVHAVGSGIGGHYSRLYLEYGTRNRATELLREPCGHIALKLAYVIIYLWIGRLVQLAMARKLTLDLALQISAAVVSGVGRALRAAPEQLMPEQLKPDVSKTNLTATVPTAP